MFKSFLKKFEETTESIRKSTILSPQQQQQQQHQSQTSSQQQQQQQQPQQLTQENNQNNNNIVTNETTTTTTTENLTETLKSLNPTNLNYQPMVDAIKESTVVQALNSSLRLEMDTIKEIEVPASVLSTVSSLTSSVTNPLYMNPQSIPNVSQQKDSLKEVDLYNGTLLLRNFEVKLKQIRINGQILAEHAEEVDKKFPELIKVCAFQHDVWKKADAEFSKLGELNSLVETIQLNLDSIISKIESLEINLSLDIDNYLDNELSKWKDKKESEIIKFDSLKKLELNKLQEDLSLQYQKFEREKILKERKDLENLLSEKERERKFSNPPKVLNNSNNNINNNLNSSNNNINNNINNNNINNNSSNSNNNNNDDNIQNNLMPEVTIDNIIIENPNKEELESFLDSDHNESDKI
ncbi:hypothetical protein ACTFIU_010016 [Dictyostelium citrinum]